MLIETANGRRDGFARQAASWPGGGGGYFSEAVFDRQTSRSAVWLHRSFRCLIVTTRLVRRFGSVRGRIIAEFVEAALGLAACQGAATVAARITGGFRWPYRVCHLLGAAAFLASSGARAATRFEPPAAQVDAAKQDGGFINYTAQIEDLELETIAAFNKRFPFVKVETAC